MALTNIRVITVYVRDQDAALIHYRDVLGFEIRRDVEMGKGRWIEAAIPGDDAVLMLADAAAFGMEERVGEFAPCTFDCDDAVTTRGDLAGRGADVSDIEAEHWGRHFYMRDQDGNNFLVREAPKG
jgi:uncharacterized glyoxalase superfamily protein PhnB